MSGEKISDEKLIAMFLRGELLDDERTLFELRKKEEAFLTQLNEAVITYQGRLHLKEKLQTIGDELKLEKSTLNRNYFYWISGMAASLLLLFGIYLFTNQNLSSQDIFNDFFQVYPNVHATKGNTDNKGLSLKAFDFYDNENYIAAASTFEKMSFQQTLNSSEHFYYGISLLAIDELENAKKQFKKVVPQHPLYSEAQWYTSLSLIKQDSIGRATTILTQKNIEFSTSRELTVKNLLNKLSD